jgi:hypothetical protein
MYKCFDDYYDDGGFDDVVRLPIGSWDPYCHDEEDNPVEEEEEGGD